MKLVCFNANSIRIRMHQLQAIIEKYEPDIIGVQETKVADDAFPVSDIAAMGYHVQFHGQKTHYGVCIISKQPLKNVQKGFPTDTDDAQRRFIVGEFEDETGQTVTILNGYFPQGENVDHETKFPAKEKYYADLQAFLNASYTPNDRLIVMGDM
ncbi:MAG: exodeoxyribonuclease III, partial [Pontibacterium sp.]